MFYRSVSNERIQECGPLNDAVSDLLSQFRSIFLALERHNADSRHRVLVQEDISEHRPFLKKAQACHVNNIRLVLHSGSRTADFSMDLGDELQSLRSGECEKMGPIHTMCSITGEAFLHMKQRNRIVLAHVLIPSKQKRKGGPYPLNALAKFSHSPKLSELESKLFTNLTARSPSPVWVTSMSREYENTVFCRDEIAQRYPGIDFLQTASLEEKCKMWGINVRFVSGSAQAS